MKVAVITISDRAYTGGYEDRSGPTITGLLTEAFPNASITTNIVPDEEDKIEEALHCHKDFDYIFTTGGTGIGPKDITPEITEGFCEKALPGIAETLRAQSYKETPNALLSRGFAGMRGKTIIVNFPGSVKAVQLCTNIMIPVMEHGIRMIRGEGH